MHISISIFKNVLSVIRIVQVREGVRAVASMGQGGSCPPPKISVLSLPQMGFARSRPKPGNKAIASQDEYYAILTYAFTLCRSVSL